MAAKKPKPARIIQVVLKDSLRVDCVADPDVTESVTVDIDFTGNHYTWALEKLMSTRNEALPFNFPSQVAAAANAQDDPNHQNTVAIQSPEFIKIDCGYWGSYLKDGKRFPFRDFGLVQGDRVWQCQFDPAKPHDNLDDYIPKGASPVRKFLDAVKAKGFGVKMVQYAVAPPSPATDGLDFSTLYVLLPDLHLPERWPDEPTTASRHKDPDARAALQTELICCQHAVGWK